MCLIIFFLVYLQTSSIQQLVTPEIGIISDKSVEPIDTEIHDDHGLVERFNNETHVIVRYQISSIDFDRVSTPFIIGLWILSASIAKICKFFFLFACFFKCVLLIK